MIFLKTQAGQQALRERHGAGAHLAPRQRSAFILFDGKRTVHDVLTATAAMGITMDDVEAMVAHGLLEAANGASPAPGAAAAKEAGVPAGEGPAAQGSGRSAMERYQAAYPIAIELTAAMGLRGFRLNLAVEGTTGYEQLAELAPKIQSAVGDANYQRLAQALFD